MMKGKEHDELYRPMEKNHIVKILDDGKVDLTEHCFIDTNDYKQSYLKLAQAPTTVLCPKHLNTD
jgi:hypothetical protein